MTEPNLVPDLIRKITDLERRLYELERRRIPAGGTGGDLWSLTGATSDILAPDGNAASTVNTLRLHPNGPTGTPTIVLVDSTGEIDLATGTGVLADLNASAGNDFNLRATNDANVQATRDTNLGATRDVNISPGASGRLSLTRVVFQEAEDSGGGYGPYTALGTIVGRIPVYTPYSPRAFVGYLPVYATIT